MDDVFDTKLKSNSNYVLRTKEFCRETEFYLITFLKHGNMLFEPLRIDLLHLKNHFG